MKFSEALALTHANKKRSRVESFTIYLVVGSTPMHLGVFVTAWAAQLLPLRYIECTLGPYGDVINGLASAKLHDSHAVFVVLEWYDLDPRLGLRRFATGTAEVERDMLRTIDERLSLIGEAVAQVASKAPVILALPGLELPPFFLVPGRQMKATELSLRRRVLQFAENCAERAGVTILNQARLDRISSPHSRRSPSGELGADLPFEAPYMSALAECLVKASAPAQPLKGLITDLDDTLWRGLVGEVGYLNVSWSLDDNAQIHGVYQQMLQGLAEQGVFIGIASKNSPEVVGPALKRADLLAPMAKIYPIEIGWGPKSEAVRRILSRWNIGAEAVAFVDDSNMELEEVRTHFPEITTLRFPTNDVGAALELMETLRDLFCRNFVTDEDKLRVSSMRRSEEIRAQPATSLDFLKGLAGTLHFDFNPSPNEPRPLELINKTNQFNINGRRLEAADWARVLRNRCNFAVTVNYRDRLGQVGTISVAAGRVEGRVATIQTWVLSCRAFARRIEYVILEVIGSYLGVDSLVIDYMATEKNEPLRAFLRGLGGDLPEPSGFVTINTPAPSGLHERVFRDR